jgi:inosine-uridine nucleoside N-ribohydrolase
MCLEVILVATGPVINVALILIMDPMFPNNNKNVFMKGGYRT